MTKKSLLYTRTGDTGTTSLVGGQRIGKDSVRLEAYGTVDELNSWMGLLAAEATDNDTADTIYMVQNRLFDIGGYLATNGAEECRGLTDGHIERLEKSIDRLDAAVEPMHCFVLPGGTAASARAQIARTVCRRAERRIIALGHDAALDERCIRFVNRLSDWLFAYARALNSAAGVADKPWQRD